MTPEPFVVTDPIDLAVLRLYGPDGSLICERECSIQLRPDYDLTITFVAKGSAVTPSPLYAQKVVLARVVAQAIVDAWPQAPSAEDVRAVEAALREREL